MKKTITLIYLILAFFVSFADNDSPGNSDSEIKTVDVRISPRYFNNKIIIGNFSSAKVENAELHIYTENGKQILSTNFNVDQEFVYYTNKLDKGNYIYYIVVQSRPIAKGFFTKE